MIWSFWRNVVTVLIAVIAGFAVTVHLVHAQIAEQKPEEAVSGPIQVPLGNRSISAYVSVNQRVLLLDPYDKRGYASLKSSLPVSADWDFSSDEIVVVEFPDEASRQQFEHQAEDFMARGVIREIAYIAQTAPDGDAESFLLKNSATIYPTPGTSEAALRASADEMGFKIVPEKRFGRTKYSLVPTDPLRNPADTVSAAARLAELQLIQVDKTRSDLVETQHHKSR